MNNLSGIFEMKVGTTVSDSQADVNGGFAYILNANLVDIYFGTFSLVKSLQSGSIIYSVSPSTIFTIKDSVIDCTSSLYTDLAPGLQQVIPVSTIGGAFYIIDAASVSSARNEIKYCHLADIGAAFYLENTVFTDGSITSKFTKNAALKGGAFYCKSCTLTITNGIISGNQAQYGGTFYLENDSQVALTSIYVDTSLATINGGFLYGIETNAALPSATLNMQNPTLINNIQTIQSRFSGGAFFLDHPKLDITLNQVIANDMKVTDSSSKGGFIFV